MVPDPCSHGTAPCVAQAPARSRGPRPPPAAWHALIGYLRAGVQAIRRLHREDAGADAGPLSAGVEIDSGHNRIRPKLAARAPIAIGCCPLATPMRIRICVRVGPFFRSFPQDGKTLVGHPGLEPGTY